MVLRKALSVLAILPILAVLTSAQQNLPASYREYIEIVDRLHNFTVEDVTKLASKAQSGVPDAEYQLALVYEGFGPIAKDETTAKSWMLKSAEQRYVPAETWLGEMYLEPDTRLASYADADHWLRLAATQGDAQAQFSLGVGYKQGFFGGIDYQESLRWLRKAAAQGLPDAQFELGEMYEEGYGVSRNYESAASWYRRAADHYLDVDAVFHAEVELANLYRDSRLKRNDVDAYMWFAVIAVGSAEPKDEDMKQVAKRMTNAQIAEAQQKAREWIDHHTPPTNQAHR